MAEMPGQQLGGPYPTNWRTEEYRQKVRMQIDDVLKKSELGHTKTSVEMENHAFHKAKTRDEYLGLVSRLVIYLDGAKKKEPAGAPGGGMMMGPMGGAQQQVDPMNALQSLTKQGMAPNMMQNGHPQVMRPQMMGQHPGMHPGPRGPPMGMQMGGPGMGMPMQHTQGHMGMQQIMMGQSPQRMPDYMMQHGSPMGHPGMAAHPSHPGHPGNMQQHSPHQYPMAPSIEHFMPYPPMGPRLLAPPPARLAPTAPPVPAPPRPMSPEEIVLSSQLPQSSPVMVQQQSPAPISQLVPSPAMMTSPSPQQYMTPSPAGRMGMDPQQHQQPQLQQQIQAGASQDDIAYLEKLEQLSRFIEPLRRMIAQTEKIEGSNKESVKLHKLLDVLLNAGTRVRMSALLKCEQVLEKMNFDVKPRPSEQHMCMPLLETVRHFANAPTINHTLHRTIGPSLAQIHGPPICAKPPIRRKRKLSVDDDDDEESEIPDVIQGEVARLERKFKVTLDPAFQSSSATVHVICRLEDKSLPHVPPIFISLPRDYPRSSPDCKTSNNQYGGTNFLQCVDKVFRQRLARMADIYSLTAILSAWELSIRQVCGK